MKAALSVVRAAILAGLLAGLRLNTGAASNRTWLSPSTLVAARDGTTLFVACTTGERVLFFDLATRRVKSSVPLPLPPSGLAVSGDGQTLYVTCVGVPGLVCIVDVPSSRVRARFPAGPGPTAPVLSLDEQRLYVCNRFSDSVSVFDLAIKKEIARIPVAREPVAAAITRDGTRLLVANHLPRGRADADMVAAVVSVIDPDARCLVKELALPNGSVSLNDLSVSPDGKYAVVSHILSRFPLPTTQLDRGWMNTNAKTLIGLERMEVFNTILLDTIDRGAANPWGTAWSADGTRLVVALAGTHEVSVTDVPALVEKLSGLAGADKNATSSASSRVPEDVRNDLAFLIGLRERHALPDGDLGPRGVAVVGRTVYTANYFSDTLSALELDGTHPKAETFALGPKPQMTAVRRGELYSTTPAFVSRAGKVAPRVIQGTPGRMA